MLLYILGAGVLAVVTMVAGWALLRAGHLQDISRLEALRLMLGKD